MIIKNKELTNDLITNINYLIEKEIPVKIAYRLMKIIKSIDEISKMKQEMETKIVMKYAITDDNGNVIPSKDENGNSIEGTVVLDESRIEDFNKEMTDLAEADNEIPFEKIDVDSLNLDSISVKQLISLEPILSEPSEI